jgi:hypothetical protein
MPVSQRLVMSVCKGTQIEFLDQMFKYTRRTIIITEIFFDLYANSFEIEIQFLIPFHRCGLGYFE